MNIIERARSIIAAEARALTAIPLGESFVHAITVLRNCQGKVVTTGMGKAGHIAQKMAGTLCSTGTPACFLHPGEAAHGDLGLIAPKDVVIAFSTSGKTREVLEMLALARDLGVHDIIGITSHPDSAIRNLSTVVLDMGTIEEPCALGLTPSASTTVMLAISDAISLVLMEEKGIGREDFGLRHHGGYLGVKARQRLETGN